MNQLKANLTAVFIIGCFSIFATNRVYAQQSMPEVLDEGKLQEQFEYLEERTRIYNNYRAIREDMFQRIKSNSMDSLTAKKNKILQLEDQLQEQGSFIDSLQLVLQSTKDSLDQAIRNKNRMNFLSIPVHKALYNSIMWTVVAGLAFLLGVLFLSNKRFLSLSKKYKNDLEETRDEFEAYRKKAMERYEKAAVQYHNELRKLKGK